MVYTIPSLLLSSQQPYEVGEAERYSLYLDRITSGGDGGAH